MKYQHYAMIMAFLLPVLARAACTDIPKEYKTGAVIQIVPDETSAESIKYAPVHYDGQKIELLGKLPTGTKITLINHITGDVFHTKVSRSGRKTPEPLLPDYPLDPYDYSALEKQPEWPLPSRDETWKQTRSTTAIIGQHMMDIAAIKPTPRASELFAKEIDNYIRQNKLLDSVLGNIGEGEDRIDVYRDKLLKDKLPELYTIVSGNKRYTLISYPYNIQYEEEGLGPKLLLLDNYTFIPLSGNCANMPFFYTVGQQLYMRHITGQCESGYLIVGNYAITEKGLAEEWLTDTYMN